MKLNREKFIEKSIKIHGYKYNYSKSEYINTKTKVIIICENGHEFDQTPDAHLSGKGCRYCSGRSINSHTKSSFIYLSNLKHNNKYDYSKVDYINNKTKVIITCKKHGDFRQTPNLHLSKSGCPMCYYDTNKLDNDKFIKKANIVHNNKYDYSMVDYISNRKFIKIVCKKHGTFLQTPQVHLSGSGCKECMKESFRVKFNDFFERANKIHNSKYKYYEEEYFDMRTKTKVTCPIHGDFFIIPDNHISKKRGCIKCCNNISKSEISWLDKLSVDENFRNKSVYIEGKLFKFDAYDDDNKIIYEFYGDFWHGNLYKYNENDTNPRVKLKYGELYKKTIERENYLKSKGYKIISIWESEFIKNKY